MSVLENVLVGAHAASRFAREKALRRAALGAQRGQGRAAKPTEVVHQETFLVALLAEIWARQTRPGQRMRARVAKDLTTTFASHYKAEVSLEGMLEKAAVSEYNARRTGEKYLVVPSA